MKYNQKTIQFEVKIRTKFHVPSYPTFRSKLRDRGKPIGGIDLQSVDAHLLRRTRRHRPHHDHWYPCQRSAR